MNRYRVRREGFILGTVCAEVISQAQDRAFDTFGVGAIVDEQPIQGEPLDVDAVLHNRDLSIRPVYRVLFVWGKTQIEIETNLNATLQTLAGKFIKDIQYDRSYNNEEESIEGCAKVLYFDVAEVVTTKTLAQMMQKAKIHPEDVEFGIRLLDDLITNEALFDYANNLGVEWGRHTDHHKDRLNCIQAIRRHKGWI